MAPPPSVSASRHLLMGVYEYTLWSRAACWVRSFRCCRDPWGCPR